MSYLFSVGWLICGRGKQKYQIKIGIQIMIWDEVSHEEKTPFLCIHSKNMSERDHRYPVTVTSHKWPYLGASLRNSYWAAEWHQIPTQTNRIKLPIKANLVPFSLMTSLLQELPKIRETFGNLKTIIHVLSDIIYQVKGVNVLNFLRALMLLFMLRIEKNNKIW